MKDIYALREQDWRYGKLVYQVFLDRFAPSLHLKEKQHLYPAPKVIQPWNSLPLPGQKLAGLPHYQHELDFWGGDLPSLTARLDSLATFGVNTIYLTPIFKALTNHKYDTIDYLSMSPEFGTQADFKKLLTEAHKRHIAIILDGVFNHVSIHHPWFQDASKNPSSPYRDWFVWGAHFRHGYRAWHNVPSLPELNLDHPHVRDYLFKQVVQGYLKQGIDGWRLDTAIELGFQYLKELTDAAHAVKKDTVVIGEILHYPAGWVPSVDGVIQLGLRDWIIQTALGNIPLGLANQQLNQFIDDVGLETMLKSWIVLENHDVERIKHVLPDKHLYQFAKIMQWTLPGNVQLYQGEELGLQGGKDPRNREPIPWDQDLNSNDTYGFHTQLLNLRKQHRALAIGDFQTLLTQDIIGFARLTNLYEETRIILANPSAIAKEEWIMLPFHKLMPHLTYIDLLTQIPIAQASGIFIRVKLKPYQSVILMPIIQAVDGYLPTKYYR
jgi:glycosidase